MRWDITELEKVKKGKTIPLPLPEDDESGIRKKVFNELSIAVPKADDGLDKFLTFMDQKLKKDSLTDSSTALRNINKKNNQLLRKKEWLLVLKGMNDMNKQEHYFNNNVNNIKLLRKFKGDQFSEVSSSMKAATFDSVCMTDEVLYTNHWQYNNYNGRWGCGAHHGDAHSKPHLRHQTNSENESTCPTQKINPKKLRREASGEQAMAPTGNCSLTARENLTKTNKNSYEASTLDNTLLCSEAALCSVLDCSCSSTVKHIVTLELHSNA